MTLRSICIPEVMIKICASFMNHLFLLISVHRFSIVELPGSAFELVRLGCCLSCVNYLLNSLLQVGSFDVFNFKEELRDTFQFLLFLRYKILISNKVNIILSTFNLLKDLYEEFLKYTTLNSDEIIPPFRVFFVEYKFRLDTMIHG